MKQIYLTLIMGFLYAGLFAQDVSIGSNDPMTLDQSRYRSPWTAAYNYSYVQTIYLSGEIATTGNITRITYQFKGTELANSNDLVVYMGTTSRSEFDGSYTDWESVSSMTKVFEGVITPGTLPGPVSITLQTAYNYQNDGNLVIAVFEKSPDNDYEANDNSTFKSTTVTANRVMYYVTDGPEGEDDPVPDPNNPPEAHNLNGNFANITLHFGSIAPVTLADFSVVNQSASVNRLNWVTQTEQNSKGFEIQRSSDGTDFNSIGFVNSQAPGGTSNQKLNYSYDDSRALAGINYYRLRQVDADGKSSFSKIISVKSTAGISLTGIYPNPVKTSLNFSVASSMQKSVQIEIVNIEGKVVHRSTGNLVSGDNKITLDVSKLSKGMYTLKTRLKDSGEVATKTFVKE